MKQAMCFSTTDDANRANKRGVSLLIISETRPNIADVELNTLGRDYIIMSHRRAPDGIPS